MLLQTTKSFHSSSTNSQVPNLHQRMTCKTASKRNTAIQAQTPQTISDLSFLQVFISIAIMFQTINKQTEMPRAISLRPYAARSIARLRIGDACHRRRFEL